jgi:DNA-binding transcriptional LysR family regulator
MRSAEHVARRVKLRQLDIFVAVARRGSMVKAAEDLSISQPVVSKAVAELETTLGVQLFDRSNQGVEPTIYGQALLKQSVGVFDELRTGIRQIDFLVDPTAGELRIGTSESIAAGLLSAIVDPLTRQHPGIVLDVTQADTVTLQDRDLRGRTIDLIIGRFPAAGVASDLQTERLFNERPFVVAADGNRWLGRRKIELADLVAEPWCLPQSQTLPGKLVYELFRAHGLAVPQKTVAALSIHLQLALLATGRFLAIFPSNILHFSAKRLSLKALPVNLMDQSWPVGIITLKNRTLNPVATLFIEQARKVTKGLRGYLTSG